MRAHNAARLTCASTASAADAPARGSAGLMRLAAWPWLAKNCSATRCRNISANSESCTSSPLLPGAPTVGLWNTATTTSPAWFVMQISSSWSSGDFCNHRRKRRVNLIRIAHRSEQTRTGTGAWKATRTTPASARGEPSRTPGCGHRPRTGLLDFPGKLEEARHQ